MTGIIVCGDYKLKLIITFQSNNIASVNSLSLIKDIIYPGNRPCIVNDQGQPIDLFGNAYFRTS